MEMGLDKETVNLLIDRDYTSREALNSVLNALGAVVNPSMLCSLGFSIEKAEWIVGLVKRPV